MRRELVAVLGVLAAAVPAVAETRVLVAADSYLATEPGSTDDDVADVAWSGHIEWKTPARGATIDWVDRESMIHGTPRRELHELAYVDRSIAHLSITLGRFRVPGGFWLIADGASIAGRRGAWELAVFGGSRSFTNARAETLLSRSPHPLPLAGISLTTHGDVQAAVAYTITKDRVALYRGEDVFTASEHREQFFDAEIAASVGEHDFVTAGATVGTRYLVTYQTDAPRITDDPSFQDVWFGSQALYALYDHRTGSWRLDATVAALRTKLGQVTDPGPLAAITGSFVETTLRATFVPSPARASAARSYGRADGRYRLRVWADGGQAHRGEISGEWRRGWFDAQARVGLDLHRTRTMSPGYVDSTTAVYKLGLGAKTEATELLAGVAATAAIGDELASVGDSSEHAPYTLEARSFAFAHAFATHGGWFGGVDVEANLHGDGVRGLLQAGYAR